MDLPASSSPRFPTFRHRFGLFLAGLCLIGLALSPIDLRADSVKPASSALFTFEGTLNLDGLKTEADATFSLADVAGVKSISVTFPPSSSYPGVEFPVPAGGLNLSDYTGIQIEITNPNPDEETIYLRADNAGDWTKSPWSVQLVRVPPKATVTLKTPFGQSFGSAAYPLDPAHITGIKIFAGPPAKPFSVFVRKLEAYKDGTASAPATAAAPAEDTKLLSSSFSPKDHNAPFGAQYVLLKDWTFGKNRPDATVHNKGELDQEFYYRYIYNNGKLDTLPNYWTVHRDYPEGDPHSLHVFGDDNLTLKARIPEGGGLHKGGIESGMLRGKFVFTPGMYIEMRAKMTKGIGAWPAFWLGVGIQRADGTFSELPWPPEIDILEFYGFKGRETPRIFQSNIQTGGDPKKYGNPHNIFTVFDGNGDYEPGMDFAADYHVFALDWRQDNPIWLLDGRPIKQTHYEWHAPMAHILVTNQLGIEFAKDDCKLMTADEKNWDYVIDYIRVWKHTEFMTPDDWAAHATAGKVAAAGTPTPAKP